MFESNSVRLFYFSLLLLNFYFGQLCLDPDIFRVATKHVACVLPSSSTNQKVIVVTSIFFFVPVVAVNSMVTLKVVIFVYGVISFSF